MNYPDDRLLYSHEIRDWIRFSLLIICTIILVRIDTSVIYHEIRTQSVVKIYIFFNLLEVSRDHSNAVCCYFSHVLEVSLLYFLVCFIILVFTSVYVFIEITHLYVTNKTPIIFY